MTSQTTPRPPWLDRFTDEVYHYVTDAIGAEGIGQNPGSERAVSLVEVGAGHGELAARLVADGLEVTAIDASEEAVAKAHQLGRRVVHHDWLAWDGGPYDVVAFTRSLHHIEPLTAAVARAQELAPGGLLICDEFARERLDERSAQLLYDSRALLNAIGMLDGEHPPTADPRGAWVRRFTEFHPIATGQEVLEAVEEHATMVRYDRVPFIGRFVGEAIDPAHPMAEAATAAVVELERSRVEAGLIPLTGFRLVARLQA